VLTFLKSGAKVRV